MEGTTLLLFYPFVYIYIFFIFSFLGELPIPVIIYLIAIVCYKLPTCISCIVEYINISMPYNLVCITIFRPIGLLH